MTLKKIIHSLFNNTGIYIGKRPTYKGKANFSIDGLNYGFSFPSANYTPWQGDASFMNIYNQIKDNTLVDIYRCYELWQLLHKINVLDPHAAVLEVGVWRGGTAGIMSQRLADLKSSATLYLADTFSGVAKAGANDSFYTGGEHSDTSQQVVEDVLKNKSGYPHYKILKGIFPEDTVNEVSASESFGLCHIDVDVYDSAKDILEWVWDKLIPGGVVVFDDYGFHSCTGVTKLVEEYRNRSDRHIIHNLNGHALMIKLK
ncbi:MAG: class I SAM-dependent methyltransferase [Chitinophagaceae bacterium]|nr:class I SAM-dependent methyltransferase [Chitinophagaceae bacterium]